MDWDSEILTDILDSETDDHSEQCDVHVCRMQVSPPLHSRTCSPVGGKGPGQMVKVTQSSSAMAEGA